MSLSEGDLVADKFRIQEKLGEGGMGVVWAARDENLGRAVAIKVLPQALAALEDMAQRFLREAMAAAQLDNDHAVRIFDQGKLADGTPYIVMERLQGEDLDELLAREGPLPIAVAVDYTLQACVALSAAHAKGIVHRDLKPANLFLHRTEAGRTVLKVLDFGIAKLLDAPKGGALTRTNQQLGTPLYMSPEQHLGDSVDARTDIWSIGVILFELLSGKRPFDGETFGRVLQAVCNEEPPELRTLTSVPGGLDQVVRRCLSKDRDGRYPTVASLVLDLGQFAAPESRRLIESIHPPPNSLGQLPSSNLSSARMSEGGQPGASLGSAPTVTADTRLAVTRESEAQSKSRGSLVALGMLGVLGAAGAYAWSLLPSTDTPESEAVASASAVPETPPKNQKRDEPQATPVVDSHGEDEAHTNVETDSDPAAPDEHAESEKPKQSGTLLKQSPKAKTAKAGVGSAKTQETDAAGGSFSVSVRVQHAGHSCAAQPGGTELTLVVGDFSQRQALSGCRATFAGIPAKYKGKTASFAGSGALCSLSGGGALGANMVVGAKRRGAPCSADGVAACECKNPCLGHECL